MPSRRTIAVALAATATIALTVPTATAVFAAPAAAGPNLTDAGYGGGYLARQISAGSGHLESNGVADVSDTAYAVLALHAAGVGKAQSAQAITFLKANLGTPLQESDGTGNPGLLSYVIMAAVASGQNPAAFGGTKPVNDLTARLLATVRTSGADAGLVGDSDPTYDGAFRQGVALAALKAAGVKSSAVSSSIAWLKNQQCSNGLWESYRPDPTVACAAADPSTFTGPDTNSTGMAAQGLAAYGLHPLQAKLVASLQAVRSADGGFPYLAAAGQTSDPDSTALSIQALLADGGTPGAAYAALDGYQLGCGAAVDNRGAYYYPGSRKPSLLATVQAVPAAAGVTLPLPASTPSAALPAPTCTGAATAAAVPAVKAATSTAGACSGTTGVTVTVDFTSFSGGVEQTRCATGAQSSGVTALQNAGFTPTGTSQYGLAFICRIDNRPSAAQQPCTSTPPANAYWSYYHASPTATAWTYSSTGASSYKPAAGSIEAWAFGDSATPSLTPAQVRKAKS